MSLPTDGIYYTISPSLSGAMEDCSIVRVQQLQMLLSPKVLYVRARRMFDDVKWALTTVISGLICANVAHFSLCICDCHFSPYSAICSHYLSTQYQLLSNFPQTSLSCSCIDFEHLICFDIFIVCIYWVSVLVWWTVVFIITVCFNLAQLLHREYSFIL